MWLAIKSISMEINVNTIILKYASTINIKPVSDTCSSLLFGGRERKIDQLLKQTKWKSTFHKKRNQNTQKLCYVQVTPIFTLLQGMEQLTNSVKAEILFRSRD